MGNKRRPIAVIDCESDPFKKGRFPKPFIWGFYDGERYEEFTDLNAVPDGLNIEGMRHIDEFIEFLYYQEYIVYAHNGGKFDYHFLLDYIEPFSEVMIIAGRIAKFKIGDCEFRDSFNIMPVALDKWQKQKFDYSKLEIEERYKPHNWQSIRQYLYSDCVNLYEMVNAFINRNGIQLTQASASMKAWQKMTGLKAPKSSPEYYDEFKQYYYGGRVECFRHGVIDRPFKAIDLNSAYPYSMLSLHPIGLGYEHVRGPLDDMEDIGPYFFKVRAKSAGAFPFRADDGSLFFPDDGYMRVFTITGWELMAARDTGALQGYEVLESIRHFELIDFKDYILPLYEERKQAKINNDKENDLLAKLLMNSLYGKFAADPRKYKSYMVVPPEFAGNLADDGYTFAGDIGPWILGAQDNPEEQQRFYNVATAASITGYVRAYMWRALCQCEGLIYCDTDSIAAFNIEGVEMGDELGQWSLDGNFSRGAVAGKKLYAFNHVDSDQWKIASKGVRLNHNEIVNIAQGGIIEYEPEVPTYSARKAPRFTNRVVKMTGKKRATI